MAKNVKTRNVVYNSVPSVSIPLDGSSGNALFVDTSDATLNNSANLPSGVSAYANGVKYDGSASINDSSDMTVSGATVTAPAGFYDEAATKSVASGTATPPASISGTSASLASGTNTITLSKTVSVTPVVSAGYISSGTAGNASVSLTASVTTKSAATITPSTSNQSIAAGTYLTGAQTVLGDSELKSENIVAGKTIFNIQGSAQIPQISQDSTSHILSIS